MEEKVPETGLNSPTQSDKMTPAPKNRRKFVILGIVGVVALILVMVLSLIRQKVTGNPNLKASQELQKGNLAGTADNLKDAYKQNPQDPVTQAALITAIAAKGNQTGTEAQSYEEGKKYADEALKNNPDNVQVLLAAGYLHEVAGDYSEAYKLYVKAKDISPESALAWYRIGHVIEFANSSENPATYYQTAYRLDSNDPLILVAMGKVMISQGKNSEAVAFFLKAVENKSINPSVKADAYTNASVIKRNTVVEMREALELSKKAVEADPTFSPALAAHGFNLGISGDTNEGMEFIKRSIEANPRISLNYWYGGIILRSVKKHEESISYYTKAYEHVDSDNTILGESRKKAIKASYQYEIALAMVLNGQSDGVISLLSQALLDNPALKARFLEDEKAEKFKILSQLPEYQQLK